MGFRKNYLLKTTKTDCYFLFFGLMGQDGVTGCYDRCERMLNFSIPVLKQQPTDRMSVGVASGMDAAFAAFA